MLQYKIKNLKQNQEKKKELRDIQNRLPWSRWDIRAGATRNSDEGVFLVNLDWGADTIFKELEETQKKSDSGISLVTGPLVKTPYCQCRGHSFSELKSHMLYGMAKRFKKKKNKKTNKQKNLSAKSIELNEHKCLDRLNF